MQKFSDLFLTGLLSFLLIFSLVGCGGDDDDDELSTVSKAAYIVNGAAETLSVFNIATSEIQNDVLTVGKWPNDIQIAGSKAYVVNTGDNNVQIIDLEALMDAGLIDIGEGTGPEKMGIIGSKAYVSCNYTGTASVVDLASGQVTKSIQVGFAPWGVAAAGQKVYVCNTNTEYDMETGAASYGDGTVSVIDSATDEVVKTIDVGINPTEIGASGDRIVVLCTGNYGDVTGKLCVIDTASDIVTQTIELGVTPSGLGLSPGGRAYIPFSGGLIPVNIDSGAVEAPLTDFAQFDLSSGAGIAFDRDGNGYICTPDWTGAGGDRLLVMDSSENLIGTYVPGGGASIIGISEQ